MLAPMINEIIARKGINVSIYNMKKAQFRLIERKFNLLFNRQINFGFKLHKLRDERYGSYFESDCHKFIWPESKD